MRDIEVEDEKEMETNEGAKAAWNLRKADDEISMDAFQKACDPAMKYLKELGMPHYKAIITDSDATLSIDEAHIVKRKDGGNDV